MTETITLDQAIANQKYRITELGSHAAHHGDAERRRQLFELGFIKGESVILLRRTMPGCDPMVVRVGNSTFALRQVEAKSISVVPEQA
jgi:ferrous iron transport protein A